MTSSGGLAYHRYDVGGIEEWIMQIGAVTGAPVLFLPPLFEELNRTRALMADLMRLAADEGYGCWLPDLPGTGESERPLEECGWAEWGDGVKAAAERVSEGRPLAATVSVRGGCLLDDAALPAPRWRFAPVEGASLARDLARAGLTSGGGSAGYAATPALLDELQGAKVPEGGQVRTVRLTSDRGEADAKVEGPALWRRSEPDNSAELARVLAEDLKGWLRQCAAS